MREGVTPNDRYIYRKKRLKRLDTAKRLVFQFEYKSYYYWLRKFRKESYDQMQLPAATEEPAEISFVEFAAPTSEKVVSTQDSLNSTTTAVIRHGAITLEISNAISEEVLSLLLKEVIHAGERC